MNRLKSLRKASKMTIAELGKMTGLSKSAIQRWETGQCEPSFRSYAYKLADVFSCTQAFLTGDEQEYIEVYVDKNIDPSCLSAAQWERIVPFVKPECIVKKDEITFTTKKRQVTLNPTKFVWTISEEDFKAVYGDGRNKQELIEMIAKMDNSQIADMVDFARRYVLNKK